MSRTAVSFCAALLLGGCGLADSIRELKSLAELGVDDGASEGVSMALDVTPDEEAELALPTGAKLVVPKGAVDSKVTLSITRPKDAEALELVQSVSSKDKVSSAPYVLKPHGTQFKKGVEVTLPVAKNRDSEKLVVAWLEDEKDTQWKTLGKPEVKGGVAKIAIDHFSVLVLLERTSDGAGGGAEPGDEDGPSGDGEGPGPGGEGRFDAGVGSVEEKPDAGGSNRADAGVAGDGDNDAPVVSVVDSALCGGCEAGQECVQTKYAQEESYFSCKIPCATSEQCGAVTTWCEDGQTRMVSFPVCSGGYCGYPASSTACVDDLGNPTACVDGACTSAPITAIPYGQVDQVNCGGCEVGTECFHIEDQYAEGGSYFACKVPCAIDDQCPAGTSECLDGQTLTASWWWCEPLGYCTGVGGVFPCTDGQGNPTACVDGACLSGPV